MQPELTVVTNTKLMTTVFLSNARYCPCSLIASSNLLIIVLISIHISVFCSHPSPHLHLYSQFCHSFPLAPLFSLNIQNICPPICVSLVTHHHHLFFYLLYAAPLLTPEMTKDLLPQSDTSSHYITPVPLRLPCDAPEVGAAWHES